MLGRSGINASVNGRADRDGTTSQPLLSGAERGYGNDSDGDNDEPIIFALNSAEELSNYGDPNIPEHSALDGDGDSSQTQTQKNAQGRGVRFQDYVQIIGPPLRSTVESREAGA